MAVVKNALIIAAGLKFIIVSGLTLIFFSCVGMTPIPKITKEAFTLCYNGHNTNLDDKIKIHGFYIMKEIYTSSTGYPAEKYTDTSKHSLVFYNDGFFCWIQAIGDFIPFRMIPLERKC